MWWPPPPPATVQRRSTYDELESSIALIIWDWGPICTKYDLKSCSKTWLVYFDNIPSYAIESDSLISSLSIVTSNLSTDSAKRLFLLPQPWSFARQVKERLVNPASKRSLLQTNFQLSIYSPGYSIYSTRLRFLIFSTYNFTDIIA